MPEGRVFLQCFPSSDEEFRSAAERLLAGGFPGGALGEIGSGPWEIDRQAFEVRLRTIYPDAEVHARDALASFGLRDVWYVYRGATPAPPPTWRVLVVEDDLDLARMIEAAVATEGAEVRTAPDGETALSITEAWHPDTIVLDLGLPNLDGPGFADAYRRRAGDVPIVVVSGAPDASATSRKLGARACLSKPFELDHLLELVRPTTADVGVQLQ